MHAADDEELRRAIRGAGGPDTSALSFGTTANQHAALVSDVERVRSFGPLAGLHVGGFLYDVDTGRLSQVC
jgi:hypothetical protein